MRVGHMQHRRWVRQGDTTFALSTTSLMHGGQSPPMEGPKPLPAQRIITRVPHFAPDSIDQMYPSRGIALLCLGDG